MQEFENSALLPWSVISAVREFNATLDNDTQMLIRILDVAIKELPENFLYANDMASQYFKKIEGSYFRFFGPLKPKADEIVSAIRASLKIDAHIGE